MELTLQTLPKAQIESYVNLCELLIQRSIFVFPKKHLVLHGNSFGVGKHGDIDIYFTTDELKAFFDAQQAPELKARMEAILRISAFLQNPTRIIGKDSYAWVFEIPWGWKNKKRALKVVDQAEAEIAKLASENGLGVKVYDVLELKPYYALVMKLMDGDLRTLGISKQNVIDVSESVISLSKKFFEAGYMHGDLSPRNVLWKKTSKGLSIKLSDFGKAYKADGLDWFSHDLRYFFQAFGLEKGISEIDMTQETRETLEKFLFEREL